jgi:hypothetical protein
MSLAHIYVGEKPVSAANPVPVAGSLEVDMSGVEIPPPVGGATEDKQDDEIALLGGGLPAALTVGGNLKVSIEEGGGGDGLTDTQLRASAVPVSVSGVATADKQDALAALVGEVQASPTSNTLLDRLKAIYTALTSALPAGTNTVGAFRGSSNLLDVVLTLDTNVYASGDVLAATQAVASAVPTNGGHALLHSLVVNDKDDQGQAMDLVFLRTDVSIGTENAAVSIADADASEILGIVSIAAGDFLDLGGCRVATVPSIGLVLEADAASSSIFIAAISRGTGTYSATGVTVKIGLAQQDY